VLQMIRDELGDFEVVLAALEVAARA